MSTAFPLGIFRPSSVVFLRSIYMGQITIQRRDSSLGLGPSPSIVESFPFVRKPLNAAMAGFGVQRDGIRAAVAACRLAHACVS